MFQSSSVPRDQEENVLQSKEEDEEDDEGSGGCGGVVVVAEHSEEILAQLDYLVQQHGECQSRRKHVLQPRHCHDEFVSDSLFDQFARAVCDADYVWRKELLEAWAVALFVHSHFPPGIARIVDCASGHGLLAWAILVLHLLDPPSSVRDDEEEEEEEASNSRPLLTAVCVDIKMPKAADKLAAVMVQHWPELDQSLDYVESRLEMIVPSESTLIVGVHCCGVLSDKIVDLALRVHAPLALVPCCHTKKSLRSKTESGYLTNASFNLAEYLDQKHMRSLIEARYRVQEGRVPIEITPKNRIILAAPTRRPRRVCNNSLQQQSSSSPIIIPPLLDPANGWSIPPLPHRQRIVIPVADTPHDKAVVKALAGRQAGALRKLPLPTHFNFSLYLPPGQTELTANELKECLFSSSGDDNDDDQDVVVIDISNKPPPEKYTNKRHKTFRIIVPKLNKEQAKMRHIEACHRLPLVMEGAVARCIPR